MDLELLKSGDWESVLSLAEVEAHKINNQKNVVTICIFIGGEDARQKPMVTKAIDKVKLYFRKQNIAIIDNVVDLKYVFETRHFTPNHLFDYILGHDIHVIPTHGHQNTIGRGMNGDYWTANEYVNQLLRLTYHLGYPNGKYLECPVYQQDKVLSIH